MPLNAAIFTVTTSAACASEFSASFSEASLASNAASAPALRARKAANDWLIIWIGLTTASLLFAFGGAQSAQEVAHGRVIEMAQLDAVEQGRQRIIDRDALVVRREHFREHGEGVAGRRAVRREPDRRLRNEQDRSIGKMASTTGTPGGVQDSRDP